MIALYFMIYAMIGAGAGYGLHTYMGTEIPLSICAGAIVTALIGQVHLFASRAGDSSSLATRIMLLSKINRMCATALRLWSREPSRSKPL